MNTIFIIIGFVIILTGVVVKKLRLYDLIAGYNTMSPKEKSIFDIDKFPLLIRNVFVVMGICIISGALISNWLVIELLSLTISLLTMFVCLGFLIYMGQKLKNQSR